MKCWLGYSFSCQCVSGLTAVSVWPASGREPNQLSLLAFANANCSFVVGLQKQNSSGA